MVGLFKIKNREIKVVPQPILETVEAELPKRQFETKLSESKGVEINLTTNEVLLYSEGEVVKTISIIHQSPTDKWYQAPTGHYRVGIKHENHLSSLFPVTMPYSVQFYEDFFMHGIPYYENGTAVSSNFTGGCLRFTNEDAKEIYDFVETGDEIVSYETFDNLKIKKGFYSPVDIDNFWIRQRFNNPYRNSYDYGGTDDLRFDYYQHTGVDFAPNSSAEDLSVRAITNGKVVKIQYNDGNDHGLGNTIILEHNGFYSLYAHLSVIYVENGEIVNANEPIGFIGNSGNGCLNYWRIGSDGCDKLGLPDTHLHFEIKSVAVLENPTSARLYYGYTPDYPQRFGYMNPIEFLYLNNL